MRHALRIIGPVLLIAAIAAVVLFLPTDPHTADTLMAINVVMLAPPGMIGGQYFAEDGTKQTIPATGVITLSSTLITGALKAGFVQIAAAVDALTALVGGGQTGATLLASGINRVTTVASAADSVQLPPATPGLEITVINGAAANSMNIFPSLGDLINALSANTAIALAANKTMILKCAVAGKWNSVLTA